MQFIDHEKELIFLERHYRKNGSEFIIPWGKRRVGKTELAKQFVNDKPHVYFLFASTSEREQLSHFSASIGRFGGERLLGTNGSVVERSTR